MTPERLAEIRAVAADPENDDTWDTAIRELLAHIDAQQAELDRVRSLAVELAAFVHSAADWAYEPGCDCESCTLIDKARDMGLLAVAA